jgi:hypothetical protein
MDSTMNNAYMREHETVSDSDDTTLLRVYVAPDGRWAGDLFMNGVEIGGITGCESPQAVEDAAKESGICPDRVELLKSRRPQM